MKKTLRTACIVAAGLVLLGALLFGAALLLGARPQQVWNGGLMNLPSWVSFGNAPSGYRDWDSAVAPDGAYSLDAGDLHALDLRWIAGDVELSVYSGDQVLLQENAARGLAEDEALRWGVEAGVLYIQYCAKGCSSLGGLSGKSLSIQVPAALAEKLSAFRFSGSSADLTLSGLQAQRFDFDSSSGSLQAADISAGTVRLDSSSGDLRFSGGYTRFSADSSSGRVRLESLGAPQETHVRTTSGDIRLSGDCGALYLDSSSGRIQADAPVTASLLQADLTSGSLDLSGAFQAVQADSSSGHIRLASTCCPASLDIGTSSGDVELTLPAGSGFILRYDSSSGVLRCDFPAAMQGERLEVGDGAADFRVDSSSGNLRIIEG